MSTSIQHPGVAEPSRRRKDDEDAIGLVLLTVAGAFANLDAEPLRTVYAVDADWTNAFGTTLKGRDQIVAYVRRLFADPRFAAGSLVSEPQLSLRWVDDDVAVAKTYVERAGQETTNGGVLPVRRNHSIKVLQRQADGSWLIVSDLYADARDEETLVDRGEVA